MGDIISPQDVIQTSVKFQTVDSIGRNVICFEYAWDHVLEGHPNMDAYEEDVVEVIKVAHYGRYIDLHRSDRECIYGTNDAKPPKYIKVVVKYTEENEGHVITAFLTNFMKPGESPIL